MPSKPFSFGVGDIVQVDIGVDPLYDGILLVVSETFAYGIKGYFSVPAPPQMDEQVAMRGHYETTWKAVTHVGRAHFTVPDEIFQCPCCEKPYARNDVKPCKICEETFCPSCPHIKHKHFLKEEKLNE